MHTKYHDYKYGKILAMVYFLLFLYTFRIHFLQLKEPRFQGHLIYAKFQSHFDIFQV